MAKLPAFQFYPSDWRKDLRVQSLTFEQRGVWFELLCLMHDSEERGRLVLNSAPISCKILAGLIGIDARKLQQILHVLLKQKVAYQDENGVIYNKRMVEDERIRKIRAHAGKKGGNPNLVKQNDKQNSTPSSSSSSSISEEDKSSSVKTGVLPEVQELLNFQKAYKDLPKTKANLFHFVDQNKPKFIEPYVDLWNTWAAERSKPKVELITRKRQAHFNARIREKEFDFIAILTLAAKSQTLLAGEWFTFDWFMKSRDNYAKILEGNYNQEPKQEEKPVNDALAAMDRLLAKKV